jgi:hypothetical protein
MLRYAAALTFALASPALANDSGALEAVFADYKAALRTGDKAIADRVFLPDGGFHFIRPAADGKPTAVISRPFKDVVPGWLARPDTTVAGHITKLAIQNETMATIEAKLDFGTNSFDDSFQLYKIDGQWRIVSKTTRMYPRAK